MAGTVPGVAYDPAMSELRPRQDPAEAQRPTALLAVYSWDMLSAIVAIFEALAPFAGGVAVGPRTLALPVVLQVLGALSSAAYAALLIIVASLLTRRMRWIRRVQMLAMGVDIALVAVSLAAAFAEGTADTVALLVGILIMLFDLLAIVVVTERRIAAWYVEDARIPRYVTGTLGFWVASSAALIVVDAIR